MSSEEAAIGFESSTPRIRIPNSVSMPRILLIATRAPYRRPPRPQGSPGILDVVFRNLDTGAPRHRWQFFEPVHAVVYFEAEIPEADAALGLRGFWMSY